MTTSSTFTAANGDGYELQMGRWSRRLAQPFIDFSGVTQGRVLDVGCGTGHLAQALAKNAQIGPVVGIDFSPDYIDYAKQHNSSDKISFAVGDACDLQFEDASFDHALSMLVFQFIPDTQKAVRQMLRVTRPGGTVAAATWDTRGGLVFYRMFFDTAAMLHPEGALRRGKVYTRPMSGPGELEQAWLTAGLVDVVQDSISIRMEFASFADFWAPVEGKDGPLAQYYGSLDDQMKPKLREAVQAAYVDGEPDGPRSYVATAWTVRGTVQG
jgi:SAM-dependent methyltransferase